MKFGRTNKAAYQNFLRAKYELYTGKTRVESYPSYLVVDPSSLCQLRCPLCETGLENEGRVTGEPVKYRNRALISVELFDALLDEFHDYLFYVMFFNWGEPLLNKNIPKLIKKAKSYDIYTEMHTNLSLKLTDEYIQEVLESGLDELAASIDGFSQENYQKYRRGGDLELAKSNIARFAAMRDKLGLKTKIIWGFIEFSFNEHEAEAARAHCKTIGVTFQARDAFVLDPQWLPSSRRPKTTSAPANLAAEEPAPKPSVSKPLKPCSWHYNYSAINSDGSVSPCCAIGKQVYDFGMLVPGKTSFADIWNNDAYRKSRGGRPVVGIESLQTVCTKCTFDENVHNMFINRDDEVTDQFMRTLYRSEKFMTRAFSLLYDKQRFIEFYEANILKAATKPPGLTLSLYAHIFKATHKINKIMRKVNRRVSKLLSRRG